MFPHVYAYYERHAASTRKKTQDDLAITVAAEMKTMREKNLFRQDEGVCIMTAYWVFISTHCVAARPEMRHWARRLCLACNQSVLVSQVPVRWMAEKDYGRIMSILNKEIKQQKEGFTKEELTDAYETYTNNREKQLQELQVGCEKL